MSFSLPPIPEFQGYKVINDVNKPPIKTNLSMIYKSEYNGEIRAVKEMKELLPDTQENLDRNILIKREVDYSMKAKDATNDHIVKIYGMCRFQARVFIISKYYLNETLEHYLKKKYNRFPEKEGMPLFPHRLPEKEGIALFRQICKGYEWFVDNQLIHRDLKLANIFMDGDKPAIGDLGMCRGLKEKNRLESSKGLVHSLEMSKREFSNTNLSPEQIEDREDYPIPSDIWGLGLILYQILVGKFPFEETTDKPDILEVIKSDPFIPPPEELKLSKSVLQLIDQLLKKNPEERISWNNLIRHPLIREIFLTKDIFAADVCARAIKEISNSQKEISHKKKKNFLPFGHFFTLIYSLSKIGLQRLQKVENEQPNLKLTPLENEFKLTFEHVFKAILKDYAFVNLIQVFINLPDTDDELIASLFTDNQKDFEAQFKAWFDRVRDEICSTASSREFSVENKSSFLDCITQVAKILEPSSPGKKAKFKIIEEKTVS